MCHITLSFVACPALPNFSTLSHKWQDLKKKKVTGHKIHVLIFSTIMSETFFILRRIKQDMIKTAYWSSCKVPVTLVQSLWSCNFLDRFFKKHSHIKFHENPSSESSDVPCGEMDRHDKPNSHVLQFCKRA